MLCECVRTITRIYPCPHLLEKAANALAYLIEDDPTEISSEITNNTIHIMYLGMKTLVEIASVFNEITFSFFLDYLYLSFNRLVTNMNDNNVFCTSVGRQEVRRKALEFNNEVLRE